MRRALALLTVLLLAGCSGSDDEAAPTPTASAAVVPSPSATTQPAPSPTASPTRRPAAEGDVDGDGRADTISVTATVLTVRLTGGGTVTAQVSSDSPRTPKVLGSYDVDRDGHAEVFLLTGSGASTQFASLYRYDGTVLRELLLGEEPARLGIGGSVTHGEGFRCTTEGALQVLKAATSDGSRYSVTTTTYRLLARELVPLRTTRTTAMQGDAAVQAAYTADCGGVGDGS